MFTRQKKKKKKKKKEPKPKKPKPSIFVIYSSLAKINGKYFCRWKTHQHLTVWLIPFTKKKKHSPTLYCMAYPLHKKKHSPTLYCMAYPLHKKKYSPFQQWAWQLSNDCFRPRCAERWSRLPWERWPSLENAAGISSLHWNQENKNKAERSILGLLNKLWKLYQMQDFLTRA